MSSPGPCDPRSVANLLLDIADKQRLPVTNLALQRLLYFAHALFLIKTRHTRAWRGLERESRKSAPCRSASI